MSGRVLLGIVGLGSIFVFGMGLLVFAKDFEMGKNNTNWVFFSDQVMGGKSKGIAEAVSDDGDQFVRLRGDVTTANSGGFIQIRTPITGLSKDLKGISLKIRGNGERYYVFIRTSGTMLPWQYYKADFPSQKDWADVRIEFKSFIRSSSWLGKRVRPETIKSIGIVAFGRDHKALVDVANLGFF